MAVVKDVLFRLLFESDQGEEGLSKVDKKVDGLNTNLAKSGKVIGTIAKGLGALGVGFSFKELIDQTREVTNEFIDLRQETNTLFDTTQAGLDQITASVKGTSEAFGTDYTDTLAAANSLTKIFQVEAQQAVAALDEGFLRGANIRGDFLKQVSEYGVQFKRLGLDYEQYIALITSGQLSGTYDDKGIDALKEAGLALGERTQTAVDAVSSALGQDFADDLFNQIDVGDLSLFEAIQSITAEMGKLKADGPEVGILLADIFKGAGEDAGLDYLLSLKDIQTDLFEVGNVGKGVNDFYRIQLDLQKQLARKQNELSRQFEDTANTLALLGLQIKVALVDAFLQAIKIAGDIVETYKQYSFVVNALITTLVAYRAILVTTTALVNLKTVALGRFNVMAAISTARLQAVFIATTLWQKGLLATARLLGGQMLIALRAFGLALAANPIGLMATAIGLLVAGLFALRNTFGDTTTGLSVLGNSFKEFGGKFVKGMLRSLKGVANAFIAIANLDFTGAKNAVLEVFEGQKDAILSAGEAAYAAYQEGVVKSAEQRKREAREAIFNQFDEVNKEIERIQTKLKVGVVADSGELEALKTELEELVSKKRVISVQIDTQLRQDNQDALLNELKELELKVSLSVIPNESDQLRIDQLRDILGLNDSDVEKIGTEAGKKIGTNTIKGLKEKLKELQGARELINFDADPEGIKRIDKQIADVQSKLDQFTKENSKSSNTKVLEKGSIPFLRKELAKLDEELDSIDLTKISPEQQAALTEKYNTAQEKLNNALTVYNEIREQIKENLDTDEAGSLNALSAAIDKVQERLDKVNITDQDKIDSTKELIELQGNYNGAVAKLEEITDNVRRALQSTRENLKEDIQSINEELEKEISTDKALDLIINRAFLQNELDEAAQDIANLEDFVVTLKIKTPEDLEGIDLDNIQNLYDQLETNRQVLKEEQLKDIVDFQNKVSDILNDPNLTATEKATQVAELEIQIKDSDKAELNAFIDSQIAVLEELYGDAVIFNDEYISLIKQRNDVEKAENDKTVADIVAKREAIIDQAKNLGLAFKDAADAYLNYQIEQTDALISNQEERVNTAKEYAKRGNAVLLEEEEKRLEALNKKREKFVKAQKLLALAETAANIGVGISKVFAESGVASFGTIPAILAVLGLALGGIPALLDVIPAFAKGVVGFNGKGNETDDKNLIRISNKESVMTGFATRKGTPTLLAMNAGTADYDLLNAVATGQLNLDHSFTPGIGKPIAPIFNNNSTNTSNLEGLVGALIGAVERLPEKMPSNNISLDKRGIVKVVEKYLGTKTIEKY